MKPSLISVVLLFLCCLMSAQTRSVKFEELTLNEAIQKAANEKKIVFIDCYTSWCGPCKKMAAEVFTLDRVADFFNPSFVNLKIDMEKGEGPELAKKFQIKGYPTFLILDEKGNEIYRIVGSAEPDEFINRIKSGLNPENRANYLNKEYEKGNRSPVFLKRYLEYLQNSGQQKAILELSQKYWDELDDKARTSADVWFLLENYVSDMKDPRFDYVVRNQETYKKIVGNEKYDRFIQRTATPVIFPYITGATKINKSLSQADYEIQKSKLKKANVSNGKVVNMLINLGDARMSNDVEKYIATVKKEVTADISTSHLISIILSLRFAAEEGTEAQKAEAYAYAQEAVKGLPNESTRTFIMKQLNKNFGKSEN